MKQEKHAKHKQRLPLWYYLLLFLLVGIFAGCAWYLADYFIDSRKQAAAYDELAALVEAARPTVPPEAEIHEEIQSPEGDFEDLSPDGPPLPVQDQVNADGILVEYAELYKMNPDLAGWIRIPKTKINYPVMQTPDRVDYYLQRDFQGNYSTWGCIYAREECDLNTPSDNITLYGHHMKDGSMFAGLDDYTSREFWEKHTYLFFDTMQEHHTYAIFAVFLTTATEGEGFAYHDFINAADAQQFDDFISQCRAMSLYDTGIVPEYGDKIICLSTCEYSQANGRLVVVAVRIN